MARKKYSSKQHREARRKRRIVCVVVYTLLVFSSVWLFTEVSRHEALRIQRVEVSGMRMLSKEKLTEHIRAELDGYYLKLFAKDNSLLYSRADIRKRLFDYSHRIKSVKLRVKGFQTLRVVVGERDAVGVWCENLPPEDFHTRQKGEREFTLQPKDSTSTSSTSTGATVEQHTSPSSRDRETCYFIDEEGFFFAESPHFSRPLMFTYRGGVREGEPLGQFFVETDHFRRLQALSDALKALELKPVSLDLRDGSVYLGLKGGGEIIFSESAGYDGVLENIQVILASDSGGIGTTTGEPVPSLRDLEYIDFRFGNKVFFKESEERE